MEQFQYKINELIINKMKAIKAEKKKIITNYYNNLSSNDEIVYFDEMENSIAFAIKDDRFNKLFFYSSDQEELVELLKFNNSKCVIDYITNGNCQQIDEIMKKSNFIKYAVYRRVVNSRLDYNIFNNKPDYLCNKDIENYGKLASVNDIDELYGIMCDNFDGICDHIISKDELRQLIDSNKIVIEKEKNKIVTFNVNEQTGKRLHMRYSYNCGGKENMHSIYLNVFKNALNNGATYVYSWINEKNERSLNFHHRYNMNFDGMMDIIYTNKE